MKHITLMPYQSMENAKKSKKEGLVEYAERLSGLWTRTYDAEARKLKGQFFTPGQVSRFMANLFDVSQDKIRLLDPGAGIGILTASFCEHLLKHDKTVELTLDAYENDPNLIPLLKSVLEACKTDLELQGHKVLYNIYECDFILHSNGYFKEPDLLCNKDKHILYDFVISNPPYYKLNKDSSQSRAMMELNSGQPNIYALFMAISVSALKDDGEMVSITPRSFCSGLYYKKFREWFIKNVQIETIHIFESRNNVFNEDKVLQENIIVKAKKQKIENKNNRISISVSENKDFTKLRKMEVKSSDVIAGKNGETFIRIPTSSIGIEIMNIVDAWPNTLNDLGLEISTGPVVPFRAEQYLLQELSETIQSVPLLWMHNMQGMRIVWPLRRNGKPSAILVCDGTAPLLLSVKNYALVNRFSAKEQDRRLYASVLLEPQFERYKVLGIENHVNYIYKPGGNLSVYETLGIASVLNTKIIDTYFRSLNGNTQVNATDVRSLPFPKIDDIREIGHKIHEFQIRNDEIDTDKVIAETLGISPKIIANIKKD